MISDRCFDNGLCRAEVATAYLAGLSSGINEWPRSLVRKLRRPIIAAGVKVKWGPPKMGTPSSHSTSIMGTRVPILPEIWGSWVPIFTVIMGTLL